MSNLDTLTEDKLEAMLAGARAEGRREATIDCIVLLRTLMGTYTEGPFAALHILDELNTRLTLALAKENHATEGKQEKN